MVARGDMGVEIDFTEIPMIQKDIIFHSFSAGKPVITATQMLESMQENPRPTRAEITDVANAIYDGTSAIMRAVRPLPVSTPWRPFAPWPPSPSALRSTPATSSTCARAPCDTRLSIAAATAHAACTTAADIKATAIITVSKSGETARLLSKGRPETPIIACVLDEQTQRHLALSWGVHPILMPYANSTDELVDLSVKTSVEHGLLQSGDLVVVTAGVPVGVSGTTNMIKVHMVGEFLASGVGIGNQNAKGALCICRNTEEVPASASRLRVRGSLHQQRHAALHA